MPDVKEKRKEGEIKGRILETALHLFATRGYSETSVHDIRKAARVSIGAVYHHFDNKEAIARDLHAGFSDKLTAALRDIEIRHRTAHDRCLAAVAYLFAMSESLPEATAFYLFARHREFLSTESSLFFFRPFLALRKIVDQGMARGEIRTMSPLVAVTSLFGGPLQMIRLLFDEEIDGPLMPLLEEVWACSWRAVAR